MKKLFSILMSAFLIAGCMMFPTNPVVQKAEAATIWGIDVSEHQGRINWEKVKDSGCGFAIIRCGFGQDQAGQDDDYWEYNSSECERLGIPYGTYIYSYAKSTSAAIGEANHVLRLIKGKNLSYPVYYDLEEQSQASLGSTALGNIATAFCNKIESAGYSVGVYANTSWWNNYLTASCFNNWYRWVAQYASSCQYKGRYEIWQYTDRRSVPGISGGVDANYQYASVGNSGGTIAEKLETNKSTYAQGEAINVTASTATADAWVAIYGANDTISSATSSYFWYWVHGTDDQYGHGGSWTRGQTYNIFDGICSHRSLNGQVITGSLPPGNYKVVVLYGDYKVLMSKNITISASSKAPYMETSKSTYAQGEDINIKAYSEKADAWVGLFRGSSPSYVTNSFIYYYYTEDYNDTTVSMQKVGEQNVDHEYKNLPPGTYTLTLFGDNTYNYIDATKTITITGEVLAASKSTYKPGEAIYVTASCETSGSWVGIYKKGETPGNIESLYWYYVTYSPEGIDRSGKTIELTSSSYYNGERSGSLDPGTYTIYLFGDSGYNNIQKSIDITIQAERVETGRVYVAPTCTTKGSLTITYSDGTKNVETYPANGHKYSSKMTAQTCTERGYTTHTCATCGHSYTDNYVDASGHYRGKGVADCVQTNCTACGTVLAAVKGHTAGPAATCTTPQTCTVCSTQIAPITDHTRDAAKAPCAIQNCTVCHIELAPEKDHTPGPAPSCTTDQICRICKEVLVKAPGHKPESGELCTDADKCSVCDEPLNDGNDHKLGPAATCTTPQKCMLCPYVEKTALGHDMGEATCTKPAACKRNCGYTEGEPAGHTEVVDKAVDPGCVTVGLTAGAHCSVCGVTTKEQEVVPVTGHDWKVADCETPKQCKNCSIYSGAPAGHLWKEGTVSQKPTCTENGKRLDTCERNCGETKEVTISPIGHRYIGTVVEPTCTTDGYTIYTCHNGCNDSYRKKGEKARHTPGPAPTCTTAQKCTECDAFLQGTTEHKPGPAPTCEDMQRCVDCNTILAGALGHKAGKAATCTTPQTCTADGCDYVFAKATGHKAGKEATCKEAQTCTKCDYIFQPAKEHTPGAEATCTTPQKCTECHAVLHQILGHKPGAAPTCDTPQFCTECSVIIAPATGHTMVKLSAVEATCTKTGLTEGKVCATCGDTFAAQATVAKKLHEYEDVVTPATEQKDGVIAETCKYCNKVLESTTFPKISVVKLSYKDAAYTGVKKSPDVVVRDDNDEQISSEHYTVSAPSGRVKVGTYTYTVTFHGKYEGTKTVDLVINPARPESKKPVAAKKAVTVKWKKYTKQITGYQVMVATNKNFTKNKKSLTIKKASVASKKVTGLKAKTKYYVKVRSYKVVDGKKYYSRWSDVWNIKTK